MIEKLKRTKKKRERMEKRDKKKNKRKTKDKLIQSVYNALYYKDSVIAFAKAKALWLNSKKRIK